MKVGTRVKVKGLVKAAQHNGKIGKVVKSIAADGRVGIQLRDGKQLAIKKENIEEIIERVGIDMSTTHHELDVDVLADVFAYIGFTDAPNGIGNLKDILNARVVCKKWKDAVKRTIVKSRNKNSMFEFGFRVGSSRSCRALEVLSNCVPRIDHISFWDPDAYSMSMRMPGVQPQVTPYGHISALVNFRDLAVLQLKQSPLNGQYPFIFDFPKLTKLEIDSVRDLEWDLSLLEGLPLLEELNVYLSNKVTGDIKSLNVVKGTLRHLYLICCKNVNGNFMELSKFPCLENVSLDKTGVTGDVRDLSVDDFPSLRGTFELPAGVFGGGLLQRIEDGAEIIKALYPLKKRTPSLFKCKTWELSERSPDWYESDLRTSYSPNPFKIEFVSAATRVGWRWFACTGNGCEINWLDTEPSKKYLESLTFEVEVESTSSLYDHPYFQDERPKRIIDGYTHYKESVAKIEKQVNIWKGFSAPPTEEEYYAWPGMPHA